MKSRKILFLCFTIFLVISVIAFSACSDKGTTGEDHEHKFSTDWEYDDTYHWHPSLCGHPDAISDKEVHNFNDDGCCSVCGYQLESYIAIPGLTFRISDDGTYYILSKVDNSVSNAVIPSVYRNLPVKEIGNSAFYNLDSLFSVSLPEGIEKIGAGAFYSCDNLVDINIPSSVRYVGDTAFFFCDSLKYYEDNNLKYLGNSGNNYLLLMQVSDRTADTVTIKKETKLMNAEAFFSNSIKKVYYNGTVEEWCDIGFTRSDSNPLYVAEELYINGNLVQTLTIPSSVKEVRDYAFYNFSGTSLTVSDGVTRIGNTAFRSNDNLESVILPESLTELGNYAFQSCEKLTDVSVPSSLEKLGTSAFGNCPKLNYEVENGLKYLGNEKNPYVINVSYEAEDITDATLNNATKFISENAYYNALELKTITLPSSLISIGADAFSYTTRLKNVYFNGDVNAWCRIKLGNRFSSPMYAADTLYIDGKVLSGDIVLSDSVTVIPSYAFKSTDITSIKMSDKVKSVSTYAFAYCEHLQSVVSGSSLTSVESYAFSHCSALKSVTLPGSLTFIGTRAFSYSGITEITVPSSVTTVEESAFESCASLTSVSFGSGVMEIRNFLFSGCETLNKIILPESATSIGDYVFQSCSSLTEIVIPETVTSIGEYAFRNCAANIAWGENPKLETIDVNTFAGYGGQHIIIPNTVTSIEQSAFAGSTKLTEISIPDSVTYMGRGVFESCTALEKAVFGKGLYYLAESTFKNCTSLKEIDFPSLTRIEDGVFENCTELVSIDIPSNLTDIGIYAFKGTSARINWLGTPTVTTFYEKSFAEYKGESLVIPDSVTVIEKFAFENSTATIVWGENPSITEIKSSAFQNYKGTSLSVPDTIVSIKDNAFNGCENIVSFSIPDGITLIPEFCFKNCYSLTEVYIPSTITEIGASAFENCRKLESVSLPEGLLSIDSGVFRGCSSLSSIVIPDSVERMAFEIFGSGLQTLTIPFLGITENDDYKYSLSWFFTNYSIPSSLTGITIKRGTLATGAFSGAAGLKTVVFPENITEIPTDTFSGCTGLEELVIPDTVTTIGYNAFKDCSNLSSLTLSQSLNTINSDAFKNCTSLTEIRIPDSVNFIGEQVFFNCSADIIWGENPSVSTFNYTFAGYLGNEITIPKSLKTIKYGSFADSPAEILWPNNSDGIIIESNAFNEYRGTTVYIPDYVSEINSGAFGSCNYIEELSLPYMTLTLSRLFSGIIPDTLHTFICRGSSIVSYAFQYAKNLKTVEFTENLSEIGESIFADCSSIETIIIPDGNAKYSATGNCIIDKSNKTLIFGCKNSVIPSDGSVTAIGENAFKGCDALSSVAVPDGVVSIGAYAFANCANLKEVILSESVESIYDWAFYNCSGLESIILPDSLTYLGYNVFNNCSSLSELTIGTGLKNLYGAFYDCNALEKVYYYGTIDEWCNISGLNNLMQGTVTPYLNGEPISGEVVISAIKIENGTFNNCTEITGIIFTTGVYLIGENAFTNCSSLEYITVENGNPYYFSSGNCLIGKNNKTLILGCKNSIIPDDGSVTIIGSSAFSGCIGLVDITIPDSVKTIYENAFVGSGIYNDVNNWENGGLYIDNCLVAVDKNITGVFTVKEGTKLLADEVFAEQNSLTEIVLPDTLKCIGNWAFINCENLLKIVIPESVYYVGCWVSQGCYKLTIYCEVSESVSVNWDESWNTTAPVIWNYNGIN